MNDITRVAFERDDLDAALHIAGKVRPWRRDERTPGMVRVHVTGGEARIICADHDVQIEVLVACESDRAVDMMVPLVSFAPFVSKQRPGKVAMMPAGETVRVTAGRSVSTLPCHPHGALPLRAPLEGERSLMPAASLRAGLTAALPAVIDDSARPYLGGVHLRRAGQGLAFEAQDGARIHAASEQTGGITEAVTIPQRTARLIVNVLPEDGTAAVVVTARAVEIATPGLRIISAVLDSRFPDVTAKMAGKVGGRHLRARASDLLADLELVCTVAATRDRDFRLDLGQICAASAFRVTEGVSAMGSVTLDAEFSGAPLAIGFQLPLVRDALRLFGDSVIVWSMDGAEDATTMASPAHPGVEALISPFRLAPDHLRHAA